MKTHIELKTIIDAPLYRCFDLSRSIDLHQVSEKESAEKAVAGRTTGLIRQGETVTWEATHFRRRRRLAVKIIRMQYPFYFKDVMINGSFKSMAHDHHFATRFGKTIMTDYFTYETRLWLLGYLFDRLVLKKYLTKLLIHRNEIIKRAAESDEWKAFIAA